MQGIGKSQALTTLGLSLFDESREHLRGPDPHPIPFGGRRSKLQHLLPKEEGLEEGAKAPLLQARRGVPWFWIQL